MSTLLILCAFVCFVIAAGATYMERATGRFNLIALGLAFYMAALLVSAFPR